ncbi:Rieske 2Fe-2S domain-containing protein [Lusitaniella coriacea]|uniref:aromatic ring-hydroxylating dioxygenase subunit alpha n=1 Tax=Lusitaniella coriacea TaxID=1983105 RepID=UPI003CF3A7BA
MQSEFNFFQHWYPLSPIEDLDPQQPTAIALLGMQLVIWKAPSSDTFQIFADRCPHRLAPLSEGRIDEKTGNLMCSYHGWQFDEDGSCQHIPQLEDPKQLAKNQRRYCAQIFPSREVQDLLWVWADLDSPDLAESTPLPLSPYVDASKGFVWSSFVRDLEYDWQTLVENIVDPNHVAFAHHGVQGNRDKSRTAEIEVVSSTPNRIEARTQTGMNSTIAIDFPNHIEYTIFFGTEGKQVGLVTYCIPVAPGKSRLVAQFPRNFAKTLNRVIPRWWEHVQTRNLVLDGDMILLHQQERFLQERQQQESWKSAYTLLPRTDTLVVEFRKWFDRYCNGQLPWREVGIVSPPILPIAENRRTILDRDRQHTQHCSSCRNALKQVQRWQRVGGVYFIITISVTALMPDAARSRWGWILMGTALLGLGIAAGLKYWLEPKFFFVDYIHARKK